MKRLFLILPLLGILAIALLVGLGVRDEAENSADKVAYDDRPVISRALPSLESALNGNALPIEISDWLASDGAPVTVVNFFASWCVPCRAEHPELMRASASGEIHLLGVGYKDTPEKLQGFLDQLGDPYRSVLVDADGRAGIDWGLNGVPETFVVANGVEVVGKIKGPLIGAPTLANFRALLDEAERRTQR